MNYQAVFALPCAALGIRTAAGQVLAIDFLPVATPSLKPCDALSGEVCAQLAAYLAHPGHRFDLPLNPSGTFFQLRVWQALREIPAGQPLRYGELAQRVGSAPRAVGQACAANPIPVVIPCHRVVSQRGSGGFMGHASGAPLRIKEWLLAHEHR